MKTILHLSDISATRAKYSTPRVIDFSPLRGGVMGVRRRSRHFGPVLDDLIVDDRKKVDLEFGRVVLAKPESRAVAIFKLGPEAVTGPTSISSGSCSSSEPSRARASRSGPDV